MKRILVILLFMNVLAFAQMTVKAIPQKHSIVNIFNATVNGGAGAVTTTAIDASKWDGVISLFVEMDTTDSGTPGTLGLKQQTYNSLSGNWYDYQDLGNLLDIPAANWANKKFVVNIGSYEDNVWGDSTRWVLTPQAADTGTVRVDVGGQ